MKSSRIGWCVLAALLASAGGVAALQHYATRVLREELQWLHAQQRELERVRAVHRELVGKQPEANELQRLRADRAAVVRLRAEIDRLQVRADAMAREIAAGRAAE